MDSFFAMFLGMGLSSIFYDNWSHNFDIIGSLPLEVAVIILRKLDPKSLLTAIRVCRKWQRIVKSDKILRKTVRDELIRQRKEKMKQDMFFSASIGAAARARFSVLPYSAQKESGRTFQVSIKTAGNASKKRKIAWELSSAGVRRLR